MIRCGRLENVTTVYVAGPIRRSPSRQKGAALLQHIVRRKNLCLRKLSQGKRALEVGFGRFLANTRVAVETVIESWSDQIETAAVGRHVLAIQDTSDIEFETRPEDRRGLGKIKEGYSFGLSLHAMLGVDAQTGICLGLIAGKVWTRGEKKPDHRKQPLAKKESRRWIDAAQRAREVLHQAAMITVVGDREEDFFAAWAHVPAKRVHLLTRLMNDHALVGGGTLRQAAGLNAIADRQTVELRERASRKARKAKLALRFGSAVLKRPKNTPDKDLPESVAVSFVEVIEENPPKDAQAVQWMLLTTHGVETIDDAWKIVGWYKQRWIIEQFFRVLKSQGLNIEDSALATAPRLEKLVAIAAKAAVIIIQLVQARDTTDQQSAKLAFSASEIETLAALNRNLEGKTTLQKNPHPNASLSWAAWVIAKLGGWDGYKSSRPPGPITFHDGLTQFRAMAAGWALRDMCMP